MEFIEENQGDIFYDSRTNRFFQVRGLHDDYWICSGFTKFYEDAKTVITTQPLSYKYVASSKKVICIDELEEAEYDSVGWRVKTC